MTDHDYLPVQPTMVARHVSTCPVCGCRIVPGEEITRDENAWLHLDCEEEFGDSPESGSVGSPPDPKEAA